MGKLDNISELVHWGHLSYADIFVLSSHVTHQWHLSQRTKTDCGLYMGGIHPSKYYYLLLIPNSDEPKGEGW